jgi:hypothetical protein
MRGFKVFNEYVKALEGGYALTPKAVYAAVAYSLAMRLCGDDGEAARDLIAQEWQTLHENGLVPQKPKEAK